MKGMVRRFPLYLLALLLSTALASCSEADNEEEEFADWQTRNEQYFSQLYATAQGNTAQYQLIRSYTKSTSASLAPTDYIDVEPISSGTGTASPYLTDSVQIHYRGRLIPSASYPEGYQFETTWQGTFDEATATPLSTVYYTFVDGFATVLQHMHRGDHWRVYIPYQLAYGVNANGSIPAYSTLIFEIYLTDFWTDKRGDRAD